MKKLLFLLLSTGTTLLGPGSWGQTDTVAQPIQHDKQFLLNYYQQTLSNLEKAVSGLSSRQLHYKSAPEKWSISQCLEHILLTERGLLSHIKQSIEQPANPERRKEIKLSDDDVIRGITDRSFKAQAPKEISPSSEGRYDNPAQAIEDIAGQRKEITAYIEKLSLEDMRNHVSDSPFGAVDGYHSLLYIPGHTARHTLQIEEIRSDKNFPRE